MLWFLVFRFSLLTLVADLVVSKLLLRGDPIFSLRRIVVLSLFSWVFWLIFIVIGVVLEFSIWLFVVG